MKIRPITSEQYAVFGQQYDNWNFLNCEKQYQRFLDSKRQAMLLGGFEDGLLKAAALVVLQPRAKIYKEAHIPRGFLLDWKDENLIKTFSEALKQYLSHEHVLYISMDPYLPMQSMDENGKPIEGQLNYEPSVSFLKQAGWAVHRAEKGNDESHDVSWMSVLDLRNKSLDELLKQMSQECRGHIKRVEKFDLVLERAKNMQDLEAFCLLMSHTAQRNGFHAVTDPDYYKRLLDAFGSQAELILCWFDVPKFISSQQKLYSQAQADLAASEQRLSEMPSSKKAASKKKQSLSAMELAELKIQEACDLQAKYGDRILLAGSLFLTVGKEMVYLTSGAYSEFMKYNAPYAIHMHQIEKAVQQNLDFYNFYGISGWFEKGEPGYSLFLFKKGFGSVPVELMGDAVLPVKPHSFALFNKMKHVL